jgi:hypothetical protein
MLKFVCLGAPSKKLLLAFSLIAEFLLLACDSMETEDIGTSFV